MTRMSTMEQLKTFGVIGPCSFDGCRKIATSRCNWKTTGCRQGGCDELYCPDHAYAPKDPKKPVCCIDCASQYATDNQRRRIFITVGIVLGVVVLVFGIALIAIAATRDTSPAVKRWNSTETITVKP